MYHNVLVRDLYAPSLGQVIPKLAEHSQVDKTLVLVELDLDLVRDLFNSVFSVSSFEIEDLDSSVGAGIIPKAL